MSTKHTPFGLALPCTFEVHEISTGFSAIVYDANGTAIDTHLSEEQASFIVLAVNSHDALVEALKEARAGFKQIEGITGLRSSARKVIEKIDAALTAAGVSP